MYVAAGCAEAIQSDGPWEPSLAARLVESDIEVVLWQVIALLPPALRLDTGRGHQPSPLTDPSVECLRLLRSAVVELDAIPLADGLAGVSTLSADLNAAIVRAAALGRR